MVQLDIMHTHYRRLVSFVTLVIPLVALGSIALFIFWPGVFDELAYEDSVVENISAAALVLASLTMLLVAFKKFGLKSPLLMSLSIFAAMLFFVIGMEEISWGQRILNIESSEFFLENNMQNEMNLHNLNTHLSETVYYFGALLLLIVIPFFNNATKQLLTRFKLKPLIHLLPSPWLVVPFAVMVGFVKTASYDQSIFTLIPVLVTPPILIAIAAIGLKKYNAKTLFSALISLVVVCVGVVLFSLYDYSTNGIRNWTATEWKELFIAIGIFVYALDLLLRPATNQQKD